MTSEELGPGSTFKFNQLVSRHSSLITRHWSWVLFALAVLPYFVGLADLPLTKGNEGFHAEPPREMLELGEWLVPHLNYQPRLEKPPLANWWNLLGYCVLGVSEFGYRFPTALLSVLTLLLTWRFALRLGSGTEAGHLAALILATSPNFFLLSRVYSVDAMLTLFTLASLSCFWEAVRSGRFFYLGCGLAGLGVLIKGPISLVLVAGPLACYSLATRDSWWRRQRWDRGLVLLLALAAPWYAYMFVRFGRQYWDTFVVHENVRRFATEALGSRHPFYYLSIGLTSMFPWFLIFVTWVVAFSRRSVTRTQGGWLLLSWAVALLVFLSISSGKRENYLMPLYPAVAIATAHFLTSAVASQRAYTLVLRMVTVLVVVALALLSLVFRLVAEALVGPGWIAQLWLIIMAAPAALILPVWKRMTPAQTGRRLALALCPVFLAVAFSFGIFRAYLPMPEIGAALRHLPNDETIGVVDVNFTHALFYCRRPLLFVDSLAELRDRTVAGKHFYVLVDQSELATGTAPAAGWQVIGRWQYFTPGKIKFSKIWKVLKGEIPALELTLLKVPAQFGYDRSDAETSDPGFRAYCDSAAAARAKRGLRLVGARPGSRRDESVIFGQRTD